MGRKTIIIAGLLAFAGISIIVNPSLIGFGKNATDEPAQVSATTQPQEPVITITEEQKLEFASKVRSVCTPISGGWLYAGTDTITELRVPDGSSCSGLFLGASKDMLGAWGIHKLSYKTDMGVLIMRVTEGSFPAVFLSRGGEVYLGGTSNDFLKHFQKSCRAFLDEESEWSSLGLTMNTEEGVGRIAAISLWRTDQCDQALRYRTMWEDFGVYGFGLATNEDEAPDYMLVTWEMYGLPYYFFDDEPEVAEEIQQADREMREMLKQMERELRGEQEFMS